MSPTIPRKKYRLTIFSAGVLILTLISSAIATEPVVGHALVADRAVFWSIHKDNVQVGHLLGTIHSEDPRVLDFSVEFLKKLKGNEVFATELVPDLPTVSRVTETMQYPPGKTLEAVIGSSRFDALESALAAYQVPAEFIRRMKPWAAMMTLSIPPQRTGFFMDLSLSLRASGSGLTVVGLETLEQQVSFLEHMPMAMQLKLLDQAIAKYVHVQEAHDEMVDAYLGDDLFVLQKLSDEQMQTVSADTRDYFVESGIHARNLRMSETLLSHLEDSRVFVAVGALHLPGDQGLLNLLRSQGYELRPLKLPFTTN